MPALRYIWSKVGNCNLAGQARKKAYWIDGRLLTERDLQDIRRQLQGFKRATAISDEMRNVIETEWSDLPPSCCRPRIP
jgi:hypothetical protein